jgi:uncharacterized membrane protein YoaK (UPF0700 family)
MGDVQTLRAIAVPRRVPVLLSVVAGYVDSCTYLGLFGVFVAQVTGSFVLTGTLFVKGEPGALAKLLAIPFFFVAGMGVTVLAHSMKDRPRTALGCSLVVECLLLSGFLVSTWSGMPFRGPDTPGAIIALLFGITAMGVQSALVRLLMRGIGSTNVMTTNTTLLAISAAEMLLGWAERRKAGSRDSLNPDYTQARNEFAALLPIGLGFFVGTAIGAIAYINMGLFCVLLTIFPIGGLALAYMRRAQNTGC